jgi:hypothetical protein
MNHLSSPLPSILDTPTQKYYIATNFVREKVASGTLFMNLTGTASICPLTGNVCRQSWHIVTEERYYEKLHYRIGGRAYRQESTFYTD